MMTDDELLHYARQILLSDVDVDGQERLRSAHVVVLGLGGLGSPLALYLGAAGVGRLTLVDGDTVCLLYTSPSPRDVEESRMPSSA